MRQFKQSKDCVAALSMMDSIVFGSLLRQVWPILLYDVLKVKTRLLTYSQVLVVRVFCALPPLI